MSRCGVLFGLALVIAVPGCQDDVHYTPEQDIAAFQRIAMDFQGTILGKSATLSLCEDVATADRIPESGCQYDHVVTHDGRRPARTNEGGFVGFGGGCPLQVIAFVQGRFVSGGLGIDTPVTGDVVVGDVDDEHVFGFPYAFSIKEDGVGNVALSGALNSKGVLKLHAVLGLTDSVFDGDVTLTAVSAAACE
jgi:hypothetical protein